MKDPNSNSDRIYFYALHYLKAISILLRIFIDYKKISFCI